MVKEKVRLVKHIDPFNANLYCMVRFYGLAKKKKVLGAHASSYAKVLGRNKDRNLNIDANGILFWDWG